MTSRRVREIILRLPGLNLPEKSEYVAWAQLVELTAVQPAQVAELVELGWIEPGRTGADDYLFRLRDVYRIHRLMRLVKDLDLPLSSGSIVVDLVERIEELELEIEELRRLI